jgi:hypothetical protein
MPLEHNVLPTGGRDPTSTVTTPRPTRTDAGQTNAGKTAWEKYSPRCQELLRLCNDCSPVGHAYDLERMMYQRSLIGVGA